MNLSQETLALFKKLRKDTTTAGITTGTGLNFYYLEPKAKNIYPVFYPLLASTPRVNPMFNGTRVGGTAVNWKAIVAIDPGGYPGVSEGNRNSFMSVTERNYASTYKFLGKETQVSFQSQQTGLGFDDNVALAQLGLLNALLNDEERMLLYGNSGPASVGGNGYALGTTPTPVAALVTGTGMTTAKTVSAFCVALTPWGVQLAGTTNVKLPFVRKNADSSTDIINGGTGVISAASNVVTTTGATLQVKFTVAAVVGAVGYAWFVNNTDASAPSKANAYFAAITSVPSYVSAADPVTANQKANAVDSSSGLDLTTDNSYNLLDFDGIMTWIFGTSGASQAAYLSDLGGKGLTSNGDGSILEFEAVADYLWTNFKVTPDKIYTGGNLIQAVSKAILTSSSGPGAQRIVFESNAAGQITGGTKIAQYRWKYSNTAAPKVLDVMTHPWLSQGVILFDITTNPYPAAGNTIPAVRRIVSLEDHFSIKWPYRKLQHELGVYCFETLEFYLPFAGAILTGVNNSVN